MARIPYLSQDPDPMCTHEPPGETHELPSETHEPPGETHELPSETPESSGGVSDGDPPGTDSSGTELSSADSSGTWPKTWSETQANRLKVGEDPRDRDSIPEQLGPYRIESELGVGGMGEVYRAYDELLARPVAIKLIRPELLQPGQPIGAARHRFRHEAQAAARLNHPNIVQIFHILETSSGDAIVMELVEGQTLSQILRGGALTYPEIIAWGRQVALGLTEAHAKGIVHRDLKASNIMVTKDHRVKVLDFGLAKVWTADHESDEVLTGVGQVVGSHDSMSPEQAKGYEVGPRSDLFSLGILLYQMTTGRKPFVANSAMSTLARICTEPHAPIRKLMPEIPEELVSLIDLLLKKKPSDRPSSANRVVAMLSSMADSIYPASRSPALRGGSRRVIEAIRGSQVSFEETGGTPVLRSVVAFGTDARDSAGGTVKLAPGLLERRDGLIVDLLSQFDGGCEPFAGETEGSTSLDAPSDGVFTAIFGHPQQAVQFAIAYVDGIWSLESGERDKPGEPAELVRLHSRVAVHFGHLDFESSPVGNPDAEAEGADTESGKNTGTGNRSGDDSPSENSGSVDLVRKIVDLALPNQILLSRGAFELARGFLEIAQDREAAAASGGLEDHPLRWFAHGEHLLPSGAPVELFEVGRLGRSPLRPPSSAQGRRVNISSTGRAVLGWRPAAGEDAPARPRWELEAKLGEGGFGEVWLVRHRKTRERRVLKYCFESTRLKALQREIALFRLLKEELGERADIAKVLDWNFEHAPYFIESEYTEGSDLATWVAARGGGERIPLSTRLDIVAQVAEALAAAHSVGVLHKDIKPANILMSSDASGRPVAKLADFGVGAIVDSQRLLGSAITYLNLASSEEKAGTRLYLAPEQLTGSRATVHGDIYALGVVLFQMVVGDLSRALGPGWERDVDDPLLRSDIALVVDGIPERRPGSSSVLMERLRSLEHRRREADIERAEQEARTELRAKADRARQRRRGWSLALVLLMVLGGLTTFQTVRLVQERARANREAAVAQTTSDFMVELFSSSDPLAVSEESIVGGVTVRQILDRGAERAHQGLDDPPRVRAQLLATLGQIYGHLGFYPEAIRELEASLALYGPLSPDSPSSQANPSHIAEIHWGLARIHFQTGDLQRAIGQVRLALQYPRRLSHRPISHGPISHGPISRSRASERRIQLLTNLGMAAEAERLRAESVGSPEVSP